MLNIGNKKYRNLQEQVGFNTEEIEKIFETLDGLNVQDNLIKLTASSGTLTAEEMAVVEKDVAFIIYNNNLYIKTTTSASEYTFKQIALSASDQGTYNILQSFKIVITRANGAYLYSSNTVLSLYNKAEMDLLLGDKADSSALISGLAAKADISGQAFSGAISAPSITEIMEGYSFTNRSNEWTPIYIGVSKTGNKLTIAIFFGYSVAGTAPTNNQVLGSVNIPLAIGSKLYGSTYGATTGVLDIKTVNAYTNITIPSKSLNVYCKKESDNRLDIVQFGAGGLSLNTDYLIRYEITLLLSENLAS